MKTSEILPTEISPKRTAIVRALYAMRNNLMRYMIEGKTVKKEILLPGDYSVYAHIESESIKEIEKILENYNI